LEKSFLIEGIFKSVTNWAATLHYRDLAEYLDYSAHFTKTNGPQGEEAPINRNSISNRIRIYIRKDVDKLPFRLTVLKEVLRLK
jgi:hypothetical protein